MFFYVASVSPFFINIFMDQQYNVQYYPEKPYVFQLYDSSLVNIKGQNYCL